MFSATAFVIRDARLDDVPELVRLGWATRDQWPDGRILIGEIDGVVAAALALDENRAVTSAVPRAPQLLAQMRARAAGIAAHARTPSVAERIRGGMRAGVTPLLIALLVAVALAAPAEGSVTTFATGLTNPRHVRFGPDGALYVAEAGIGGTQLATECPPVDNMFTQDGPYMAGFTGRISRIGPDGRRKTVADRLPSSHDGLGDGFGPSDIAWIGHTMYAVIEGGGCSRGLPDDPAGIVRIRRDGSYRYVADISAFVRTHPVANEPVCGPAGDCEPDGVPHSLLAVGDMLYVVETNHNSILRVNPLTGAITRVYDLSVQDPAPIILVRSGSRFLLGGFDGLIQTFSDRFGPVRTFDEGYDPITDLAFAGGRLHVLETFSGEPFSPDSGRVVQRRHDGRRKVLASGLNFPVGMAANEDGHLYRRGLYVSTVGYGQGPVEGRGRVVRLRHDRR
jgi:hypothetical protein